MKVYLDHAATTPLDKRVFRAMTPYLREGGVFANPASLHFYGRQAAAALDSARDSIAEIAGVLPQETYFTSSGSEADNWALKGTMSALRAQGKEGKLIVSAVEHHAVLHAAESLRREGYAVEIVPVNSEGIVDLSVLAAAVAGEKCALVCVMTANNETGTLQPIREIGALSHAAGAYFFTDAVQAAGCMDLREVTAAADMVSFSAHKFYGPKGAGGLCVKKNVPLGALIDGGEQERGLRGGTSCVAGAVGMAAALQFATEERTENNARVRALRDSFICAVTDQIEDVTLNGSAEKRLPGNANLAFAGVDGTALLRRLDMKGIAASAGSACAAGAIEPSHVLRAMGLDKDRLNGSVRFTFGRMNTEKQIGYVVETLKKEVKALRRTK